MFSLYRQGVLPSVPPATVTSLSPLSNSPPSHLSLPTLPRNPPPSHCPSPHPTAEWGDRSQIATVTMASHLSFWGVSVGAIAGHSVCTVAAVLGGEAIARRISQKAVAYTGAALFAVFALVSFVDQLRGS